MLTLNNVPNHSIGRGRRQTRIMAISGFPPSPCPFRGRSVGQRLPFYSPLPLAPAPRGRGGAVRSPCSRLRGKGRGWGLAPLTPSLLGEEGERTPDNSPCSCLRKTMGHAIIHAIRVILGTFTKIAHKAQNRLVDYGSDAPMSAQGRSRNFPPG